MLGKNTDLLPRFATFIEERLGIYYSPKNHSDLEKRVATLSAKLGFIDTDSFLEWFLNTHCDNDHLNLLIPYLTIGETSFFREKSNLKVFEAILMQLIQQRTNKHQSIKIWSAGCCSGEEPYSMAMILNRLLPDSSGWNISIIGTDLNKLFIEKAKLGFYKEWTFRNTPPPLKKRFFHQVKEDVFKLDKTILESVRFEALNLIDPDLPLLQNLLSNVDIIFCCNVLIYFSKKQIDKCISLLTNSLNEGGHLFVNAIEVPFIEHPLLRSLRDEDVTYFKKEKVAVHPAPQPIKKHTPKAAPKKFSPPEDLDFLPTIKPIKIPREIEEKTDDNTDSVQTIRKYASHNELEKALEFCESSIKDDSVSPVLYYLNATILQELGRIDEAIQALKHCLFLDHEFLVAHFTLANLMIKKGNTKESIRHFRNSLDILKKISPNLPIPWMEGITARELDSIIVNLLNKINK